jgi:transcription elongation factor
MALGDIILQKPFVLVKDVSTGSSMSIEIQSDATLGRVVLVNELSGKYESEDLVWYNPNDIAAMFKYEFVVYKVIDENKILFKETTL